MSQEATATEQAYSSILDTPEVEVPPRTAEAHQAEITGVQLFESSNGGYAIELNLQSLNTGGEDNFRAFLPDVFVEYLNGGGSPNTFDPSTLPEEEGNKQLSSYRRTISNKDHDALLQVLTKAAVDQGRGSVLDGAASPTSLEGFVELYNKLLAGTQVIYTKRERKNSDTGQKFFNMTGYFHTMADADNPKMFKRGVRKMWES